MDHLYVSLKRWFSCYFIITNWTWECFAFSVNWVDVVPESAFVLGFVITVWAWKNFTFVHVFYMCLKIFFSCPCIFTLWTMNWINILPYNYSLDIEMFLLDELLWYACKGYLCLLLYNHSLCMGILSFYELNQHKIIFFPFIITIWFLTRKISIHTFKYWLVGTLGMMGWWITNTNMKIENIQHCYCEF